MPRIRQYSDRYTAEDFWKEINRCCPLAGIQSDNSAALGREIGVDGKTVTNYKKRLETLPFSALKNLVALLHPDPAVILKSVGYTEKEIRIFAKEYT